MRRIPRQAAGMAALIFLIAGCAEGPTPLDPVRSPAPGTALTAQGRADPASRHQRLARRLALALSDQQFRGALHTAIATSPEREQKLHLQQFIGAPGSAGRSNLARLSGGAEAELDRDLDEAGAVEVYLPVPTHRRAWNGGPALLVATAEGDRDRPVAYDLQGTRQILSANSPPATPVLALGRAELVFGNPLLASTTCFFDCEGGPISGDGGGATAPLISPGLYMTYASFNQTFEGWLKGSPEFEVHILGQDGSSTAMKSYQCAGALAGAPYQYDQNERQWSGRVMLFSQTQLDAFKVEHLKHSIRVFLLEDDDAACVIKMDSTRTANLFKQLQATYGTLTGGKDEQLFSLKTFVKAASLLSLLKSAWSTITTQDDLVGNAIEDVVAREYFPGANWIVKGENNITNGAIRLEMR
jgi:hypothetical protein